MKIVVDENIPFGKEAFGTLGEVVTMPGRAVTADVLKNTEAGVLIVRSVTKVDSGLLDGTTVKFVGTATIGTDHIDIPYLEKNNIGFSLAPGSNANSVAEYITAALLYLAATIKFSLNQKTLGIIGVGNV
ncbi:MAG: 4-phosphoerythronate dehydrogenase, partial [Candidatus Omnitrophica bacterium]|nr:4-phosphoerythronate dehydrogenase [Candidatus Omnitrophota bacterium]